MEQFNANPIRSGVGLTVTPPQTASRSITPTESHKPDPRNLIHTRYDNGPPDMNFSHSKPGDWNYFVLIHAAEMMRIS